MANHSDGAQQDTGRSTHRRLRFCKRVSLASEGARAMAPGSLMDLYLQFWGYGIWVGGRARRRNVGSAGWTGHLDERRRHQTIQPKRIQRITL